MGFLRYPDFGLFCVRLGLGIMLMMHGIAKILNGVGFVKSLLTKQNLPEFIAYGVYIGEFFAPILLILGIFSRLASIIILSNCIAILFLFHMPNGDLLTLTSTGGFKAEIIYLYVAMAFCVLFSGSGKYTLKHD